MNIFISHASEDKVILARPLAHLLRLNGYNVWYDEYELKLGDSLRLKIQEGLIKCRYGIVILSPSFFGKKWTEAELDTLFARETIEKKIILPIWHNIDFEGVMKFSPMLAGKLGVNSSEGLDKIVESINTATRYKIKALDVNFKIKIYQDACEDEEWLKWFCGDLVNNNKLRKDNLLLIKHEISDFSKVIRILNNLSYILLKEDLRYLFYLIMHLYDSVDNVDDIIKNLRKKGLTEEDIVFAGPIIPHSASTYLCQIYFEAFYQILTPLLFSSLILSLAFIKYSLIYAYYNILELFNIWNNKIFNDYESSQILDKEKSLDEIDILLDEDYQSFQIFLGDAVDCIIKLVDEATSIDVQAQLKSFLKNWFKAGMLSRYMKSKNGKSVFIMKYVY